MKWLIDCRNYLETHHKAKVWFQADVLYLGLIILYQILHFQLQPVDWHIFFKMFLLLNLCLLFKTFLDNLNWK